MSKTRSVTLRIYIDQYGNELITPHEVNDDLYNFFHLVHTEQVILTMPELDIKQAQAKALEKMKLKLGDKCKQEQAQIDEQIKQLTGGSHE